MYIVTEEYKSQFNRPLRNFSHVEIVFGLIDPDAPGLSSVVDNGGLPYSNSANVDLGTGVTFTYSTLEKNRFVLNGKNPIPPTSNWVFQGYCGNKLSDENGVWGDKPKITINFSEPTTLSGLTFLFDYTTNDHPVDFRIKTYLLGSLVSEDLTHPTNYRFIHEMLTSEIDKIELIFEKSKFPYRRARLLSLTYGLIQYLETKDVSSVSITNEIDILSSKLPKCDMSFSILDFDKKYDPESPDSIWAYLEANQPVSYRLGYELDDGDIEWINMSSTYTTGEISISNSGIVTEITFKTSSIISKLQDIYNEDVYRTSPISLFDLANNIMVFAGFPQAIVLDDYLKTIYTTNTLYNKSVGECLQLIANAGMCVMSITRDGSIRINRRTPILEDFNLDLSRSTSVPTSRKYPQLRSIITSYSVNSLNAEYEVIGEISVNNAVNKEVIFNGYTPSAEFLINCPGVTIIGTPLHFSTKTILNVTGTGKITLSAKKILSTNVEFSKQYNLLGSDLEISNPLISTVSHSESYCDWVATILNKRTEYASEHRGFPEIDVLDNIYFQGNFASLIPVTVLSNTTNFNGTISGNSKLLIGGDV